MEKMTFPRLSCYSSSCGFLCVCVCDYCLSFMNEMHGCVARPESAENARWRFWWSKFSEKSLSQTWIGKKVHHPPWSTLSHVLTYKDTHTHTHVLSRSFNCMERGLFFVCSEYSSHAISLWLLLLPLSIVYKHTRI